MMPPNPDRPVYACEEPELPPDRYTVWHVGCRGCAIKADALGFVPLVGAIRALGAR